jgi:hypothetical protein
VIGGWGRSTKCVEGLHDVAFLLAKGIFVQSMVGEAVHDCEWKLYSAELRRGMRYDEDMKESTRVSWICDDRVLVSGESWTLSIGEVASIVRIIVRRCSIEEDTFVKWSELSRVSKDQTLNSQSVSSKT